MLCHGGRRGYLFIERVNWKRKMEMGIKYATSNWMIEKDFSRVVV